MNKSLLEKHRLTKSQIQYLSDLKTELEKCNKEVLEKISLIKAFTETRDVFQLLKKSNSETHLELFHGIDGYDLSCEALGLYDVIKNDDWEAQQVFNKWDTIIQSLSYENKIGPEDNLNFLYKDIREEKIWKKNEAIFFRWLVKLWHQTGLHRANISAYTLQNNSVEMFDLNRCCWHDYLPESERDYNQTYQHKFDFEFSTDEIEARISLKHAQPNITYWRHLQKGNEVISFALYEDIANVYAHQGNYQNAQLLDDFEFEKREEAVKYTHYWVDKKMLNGYREVLITEDKNWNITPEYLHFDTIQLSQPNLLSNKKIVDLENTIGFQLPISYKNFISNFHEAALKTDTIGFPIDDISYGKLNRFFWNTANDVKLLDISENKYLIIADTKKEEPISINQKNEIHLHQEENNILLANSFETFLQSFFNYQFTPSVIEIKMEQGDIDFFKKHIQENFIDNKTEDGKTILQFAIQKNKIDLVKFLLKNNASLNNIPLGWIPKKSEAMIDLLLENNYDPHQWSLRSSPFFKSNLEHWIFKDKVSEIQKELESVELIIESHPVNSHDEKELILIEEKLGVTLPDDFKSFILKHGGERPNKDWFFIPINSGSAIRLNRFLKVEEILPMHDYLKSIDCRSPFYKDVIQVPFATTQSHERIFFEFYEDKITVDIENQYEIRNYSSSQQLTKEENCFSNFLEILKHKDQIFFDDTKAILENDIEYIQNMVQKNWNVNFSYRSFGSPLSLAIYMNHFELVDILLEHGAYKTANVKNYDIIHNGKPLIYALKMGTPEMVEHLLTKGIIETDTSSDYFNAANSLIEKSGRDYLKKFLPKLQQN